MVSDIDAHLPTLREMASRCSSVTEFGVRAGISTRALLEGCPNVTSYDILDCSAASSAPGWKFVLADSASVDIEETDMLFIDSMHTYAQLLSELRRHGSKVRKWIVMHDTEFFKDSGQDGSVPGLREAISEWLSENPKWKEVSHNPDSYGLTVLEYEGIAR